MQRFIILKRSLQGRQRTASLSSLAAHPPEFSVDVENLSGSQEAEILRCPELVAMAPAMPTTLIYPFLATTDETELCWGVQAVRADTSSFSGLGVTVAVLDTGIDVTHPAFNNVHLVERDFSGNGNGDLSGHGTHCAGTIFGRDTGTRIGIARGVGRALVGKVLRDDGTGSTEMLFDAMLWAMRERANIISISLGFDFPGMVAQRIKDGWPPVCATSDALVAYRANLRMFDAMMLIFKAGAPFGMSPLVVAASGNESQRQVNSKFLIAASLPAAADQVVSVGAVGVRDDAFEVAAFSNTHPVVAAPGIGITSSWLGGSTKTLSGTSMACPHVAGVAALWWEGIQNSGTLPTAENVRARLMATARRDVFCAGTTEEDIGQGLVTAPQ